VQQTRHVQFERVAHQRRFGHAPQPAFAHDQSASGQAHQRLLFLGGLSHETAITGRFRSQAVLQNSSHDERLEGRGRRGIENLLQIARRSADTQIFQITVEKLFVQNQTAGFGLGAPEGKVGQPAGNAAPQAHVTRQNRGVVIQMRPPCQLLEKIQSRLAVQGFERHKV
jgi:hypothetical protein